MSSMIQGLIISGYAQLQEIEKHSSKILAYLHASNCAYVARRHEKIIFVCVVRTLAMQTRLLEYQEALQKQQVINIEFKLRYVETLNCSYCLTENDPDHIVTVEARLLDFQEVVEIEQVDTGIF